jgi:hypothetical protein
MFLFWHALASIGQEGDPSTCPLLSQNLRMMDVARGDQLKLNFTLGVPVHLANIAALTASRQSTIDISGTWNPTNWQRDGRVGYERSNTVEESALFRKRLQCDTVYMSFNKQRGWWMLHPTFDLGSDGTSGWAIVEAPEAEFPHQIPADAHWKVITERGIEDRVVGVAAEATPEFLLSMSALVDKNGDEVLDASEAAEFSFGGVRAASSNIGREWIAQADHNKDGMLTMREVADGYMQLRDHMLTKAWLESTAVVETSLRLLQRETARVRESLPEGAHTLAGRASPLSNDVANLENEGAANEEPSTDTEDANVDDSASRSSSLPVSLDATDDCLVGNEDSGWLPFAQASKCPFAQTGNQVFAWSKAMVHRYAPVLMLAS